MNLPRFPRMSHEETLQWLRKSQTGDREAREHLVHGNLRLVFTLIQRFQNRGHETEDLFQIGVIGLIKAIDRFNLDFGVRFSTYAVPMIMGEIQRFLRDDGPVKVSRVLKENAVKVYRAMEKIEARDGREANLEDLARETGLTAEDILASMEASKGAVSMQEKIGNEDGDREISRMDQMGVEEESRWLERIALDQAMESLSPGEREIIRLRFYQDRTQSEAARAVGLSQAQVSRLERKILKQFKKILDETGVV
jgi:RNA polymerase sporulation-specific sigma factor